MNWTWRWNSDVQQNEVVPGRAAVWADSRGGECGLMAFGVQGPDQWPQGHLQMGRHCDVAQPRPMALRAGSAGPGARCMSPGGSGAA